MRIIAHRGNTHGPDPATENTVATVRRVLEETDLDVEIDVWRVDGVYLLGHDAPGEAFDVAEFDLPRVWMHAKNVEAAAALRRDVSRASVFAHDRDAFVLTNRGRPWVYPGAPATPDCVVVMPEWSDPEMATVGECHAVCTDFPFRLQARDAGEARRL